jgi:hypothetical protein
MTKNVNSPQNLRVQPSKFKSDLTFNEWAQKYNVSRQYVEPSVLYQGNPSAGIRPKFDVTEPSYKKFFRTLFIEFTRMF